jgi:hypothetical protein
VTIEDIDYDTETLIENACVKLFEPYRVYTQQYAGNVVTPYITVQGVQGQSLEQYTMISGIRVNTRYNFALTVAIITNRRECVEGEDQYSQHPILRAFIRKKMDPYILMGHHWKTCLINEFLSGWRVYECINMGTVPGFDEKSDFDVTTMNFNMRIALAQ